MLLKKDKNDTCTTELNAQGGDTLRGETGWDSSYKFRSAHALDVHGTRPATLVATVCVCVVFRFFCSGVRCLKREVCVIDLSLGPNVVVRSKAGLLYGPLKSGESRVSAECSLQVPVGAESAS